MKRLFLFAFCLWLGASCIAQTKQPIQVKEWREADLPLVLATLKQIKDCGLADVPAISKESPPTRAETVRICIGVY